MRRNLRGPTRSSGPAVSGGAAARGLLAGAVAWWAMDQTLQFLGDRQSATLRRREDDARGGVPALEVLAHRLAAAAGRPLSGHDRRAGGTMLQWVTGIGSGVLYAGLRRRLPQNRVLRSLGYGAGLSLVVDEALVPLLGLAPGPAAFPWQTHARGFAGHLVFGAVVEIALDAIEGKTPPREIMRGSP